MKFLDKCVDAVLVPVIKTLIVLGEAIGWVAQVLLGLWPIWLLILIVAACVKVLSN